jgi:Glycosyltransferase family 87
MTIQQPLPNSPKLWRRDAWKAVEPAIAIACALTFALFALGVCVLLLTGNRPGHRDVVSFWAAGRQIDRHADPYDSASILKIEQSVGYSDQDQVLIMRNPPSALCLVMPLGLFEMRPAALSWAVLLLAAFLLSVHMLWVMHGRPDNKLHFLGYSFAPALICILGGQTSLFALLGLVLFLRFHRERQFAAGLALWLCALKPHLFLPFGAVLLMWIVVSRGYRVLAGTALAIAASSLVAWRLDPAVWTQYRQMMHSSGIENEFIPCLAVALRFAIRFQAMWLQYVPAVAGCIWAIHFYWTRRDTWDWMEHGALLMLVSILVSPYSWLTDQALLVPALLLGAYRATTRAQLGALALASALIEVAQTAGKGMHSALYLWTTPFWLAWYLYVSSKARSEEGLRDVVGASVA